MDNQDELEGPKIPRYVTNVPWYQKDGQKDEKDYRSHHVKRPGEGPVDYSEAQHGLGFNNYSDSGEIYDSKRDRWQGFDAADYDKVAEQWEAIKAGVGGQDGKEFPDYRVEMIELGLDSRHFRSTVKQDVAEKTIRDRGDVPEYINRISAGKMKADKTAELVSSDQFAPASGTDLAATRAFAWDQDNSYTQKRRQEALEYHLQAATGFAKQTKSGPMVNLDTNMEASPTATALLERQEAEQKRKQRMERHKKAIERYVGKGEKDEEADYENEKGNDSINGESERNNQDNNPSPHSSAWGSYYENGRWGYRCCHCTEHSEPCTN